MPYLQLESDNLCRPCNWNQIIYEEPAEGIMTASTPSEEDYFKANPVEFRRLSTGFVDMWITLLGKTQADPGMWMIYVKPGQSVHRSFNTPSPFAGTF